jgi:hypothetical protein
MSAPDRPLFDTDEMHSLRTRLAESERELRVALDEAIKEAIWRIENETRAAGERDKARAEVERMRPVVEAARAWGAVACECATGELEPTAAALARTLVALGET